MDIIFNKSTNLPVELDEFKDYMHETSSYRDQEFTNCLLSAIRKIELYANKSLMNHELTFVNERAKEKHNLYLNPVSEILSVENDMGDVLVYKSNKMLSKVMLDTKSSVIIKYNTTASVDRSDKMAILQYATLLANGSTDPMEFEQVLKEYYNFIR